MPGLQVEVADQATLRGGGHVHGCQARILFSHALQNARVRIPHPGVEAGRRLDQTGVKGDRHRVAAIGCRQGDAQGVAQHLNGGRIYVVFSDAERYILDRAGHEDEDLIEARPGANARLDAVSEALERVERCLAG